MKVRNNFKPDYTIDSSNINLSGTNGYSDKVIAYAKQLKATYSGYSDSYYLEQAQVHFQKINASNKKIHNQKLVNRLDLQNSEWNQFTYDEIIQMHQSGYTIPKEVLDWAYSMQESDITTYVIIPDEAKAFDETLRSKSNSDLTPDKIQENTRKYIVMAQKTEEALKKDFDNFKIISNRAIDIKNEKENSYQKQIQQLDSKIQKWKDLNNKNKQNKLTEEEKSEFKKLSDNLKQSSLDIKEMQNEYKELNEFLSSYEKLSLKTQKALEIAKETFNKANELAQLDTSINRHRTYNKKNMRSSKTPASNLPDIAIQEANNLQNTANSIIISVNDSKIQATNDFVQEYNSSLDNNINDFSIEKIDENPTENNESTENIQNETTENNDKNIISDIPSKNTETENENDNDNNIINKPEITKNERQIRANSFAQLQRIRTDYEQNSILQILEDIQTQQQSQETDIITANSQIQTPTDISVSETKSTLNKLSSINEITQNNISRINSTDEEFEQTQAVKENNTTTETPAEKTITPTEQTHISQKIKNVKITNNKREEQLEDTSDQIHAESKKQETENIIEENPEINEDETQIQNETSENQNIKKTTQEINNEILNEEDTPVYIDSHDKNATDIPENITLDNIAYAASAAVNANITQSVSTSDKEEKRLTRFNNDSIIESKKKRNRVSAVSGARISTT